METSYPCHQRLPIESLNRYPNNPRTITPEARKQLDAQLAELGNLQPITWNARTGNVISGNQRLDIYAARGDVSVDVWCVDLPEEKEATAVIALNNHAGEFDLEKLRILTEGIAASEASALNLTGFGAGELEKLLASTNPNTAEGKKNSKQLAHKSLASRFLLPPFSVLDARQGYWQERKAAWIALGLKGELGRGKNLLKMSDTVLEPDPEKRAAALAAKDVYPGEGKTFGMTKAANDHLTPEAQRALGGYFSKGGTLERGKATSFDTEGNIGGDWTGTSIFDPVLAEAIYYWFCPPGGSILDPFAGGVTRGAVAAISGHPYTGIDLSADQLKANEALWQTEIKGEAEKIDPIWINGDSRTEAAKQKKHAFDMIFSCPPYADLEKYSDDPKDISSMCYPDFRDAYFEIICQSVSRLKPNRFAAFVVGEVRDKGHGGAYHNFVADTIAAFQNAGCIYYNEMILVTAVGTLPIRVGKHFAKARKIGKTHQNVLVFFKGDPDRIKDDFPELEAPMEMPQPAGVQTGVSEML